MSTQSTPLLAFGLLLVGRALVAAADADAERLVRQLGDAQFAVREAATKQLAALDLAALPALRKAQANPPDLEVRLRARRLIDQIGARHGFVEVDGVEYRAVADRHWAVPMGRTTTPVNLGLRVTNRADRNERFVFGAVSVTLRTASGREVVPVGHVDDRPRGITRSPPLAKDEGDTFRLPTADLMPTGYGNGFHLVCEDWAGSQQVFEGLSPGKYWASLRYQADGRRVVTRPVAVEIK